jgi:hypothetical protein
VGNVREGGGRGGGGDHNPGGLKVGGREASTCGTVAGAGVVANLTAKKAFGCAIANTEGFVWAFAERGVLTRGVAAAAEVTDQLANRLAAIRSVVGELVTPAALDEAGFVTEGDEGATGAEHPDTGGGNVFGGGAIAVHICDDHGGLTIRFVGHVVGVAMPVSRQAEEGVSESGATLDLRGKSLIGVDGTGFDARGDVTDLAPRPFLTRYQLTSAERFEHSVGVSEEGGEGEVARKRVSKVAGANRWAPHCHLLAPISPEELRGLGRHALDDRAGSHYDLVHGEVPARAFAAGLPDHSDLGSKDGFHRRTAGGTGGSVGSRFRLGFTNHLPVRGGGGDNTWLGPGSVSEGWFRFGCESGEAIVVHTLRGWRGLSSRYRFGLGKRNGGDNPAFTLVRAQYDGRGRHGGRRWARRWGGQVPSLDDLHRTFDVSELHVERSHLVMNLA